MERSFDWIIAALGIMRAGAAYVPLDAAWPDSRLRFALEDSGAAVVVAREALLGRLQLTVRGIDQSRDAKAIAAAPRIALAPVDPEDLAYVIYTSGSTGVPKGVEITHANLSHLVSWHRDAFRVTPEDRASHLAGLGFDAAVWEIWANLAAGATLCLAEDAVRSSPELIQQWILREGVTISFVPTVHAAPLINMVWPPKTSLRILLTGGEALHHAPPRKLPFTVVNNYGPTESTVVATSTVVPSGSLGVPPIGRPIAGAKVHILNENFQRVPDGTTGEIYVGGSGVARGYRNLPEANANSFLSDPFSSVAGARMYRTGDRGVRRADGEIEFRGRLDRQTKIRGYRIELDEIGAVLATQPAIEFAAAVVLKGARGEDQIVAYVLPRDPASVPTIATLQEHLLRSLPEYMVPAVYVRLDALPISRNGKIDLTMLAAPSDENLLERPTAKQPTSATEKELIVVMRELLEQPSITIEDNFFLAGGHSLLGMQLVMRLRNTSKVDLSLRELFEAPTVERLAILVDQKVAEKRLTEIWTDLLKTPGVGVQTSFFDAGGDAQLLKALQKQISDNFQRNLSVEELTDSPTIAKQARLIQSRETEAPALPPGVLTLRANATRNPIFWVHYLSTNLARAMADDQAFVHIALVTEDIEALGANPTLQQIAAHFVSKIVATQQEGPYIIGGYCLGGILAYEISSQIKAARGEVSLMVLLDTPSPSYYASANILTPRLSNPRYLLKRASRIGLRSSFQKISKRVVTFFGEVLHTQPARTEIELVQHMIETAAATYEPRKYDGKVALILAADHPPHIDFLSEWRQYVSDNLHSQYLVAHHSELMSGSVVQTVAKAMASQIKYAADTAAVPATTDTYKPAGPRAAAAEEFNKPIYS